MAHLVSNIKGKTMNTVHHKVHIWLINLIVLTSMLLAFFPTTGYAHTRQSAENTYTWSGWQPSPVADKAKNVADDSNENEDDGNPNNRVNIVNHCSDSRLRLKYGIQYNQISSKSVKPLNAATATSTGENCQTLAAAAQINLYERDATTVAPENYSVGVNYQCTNCDTRTIACQWNIPVDDLDDIPDDIEETLRDMDMPLRGGLKKLEGVTTMDEAWTRLTGLCSQFNELVQYLTVQEFDD